MSEDKKVDVLDEFWLAKAEADKAHALYIKAGEGWAVAGYGVDKSKMNLKGLIALVKKNWKTISAVAAAFGIPIGLADSGAFSKILDFLPF